MKSKSGFLCIIIIPALASSLLFSCATAPVEEEPEKVTLPVEEQEKLAMQTFNDMLETTANVPRRKVLNELEQGYNKIIKEYPDTDLAQESYLRLMLYNLEDFERPRVETAENIYKEYFKKYPEPKLGSAMNFYLAKFYFEYHHWEKLAEFSTPFLREYVKTGKYSKTLYLLYYSEAKFHLKDYEEAEKGFTLMLKEFPGTQEAGFAETRLKELKSRRQDK